MGRGDDDAQLSLPVLDSPWATAEDVSPPQHESRGLRLAAPGATTSRPKVRMSERAPLRAVPSGARIDGDQAQGADRDRLLITVPEAAHVLHIGRRQAWEMVWRGELPVVRLGRSVRVARPILERFVTERSLPYGA